MKLGAHVSSAGELSSAVKIGAGFGSEVIQVFTSNPKGWNFKVRTEEEIKAFNDELKKSDIKEVFGHSIYLSNLASPNNYIYTNSINNLVSGLVLAQKVGFRGVVTHIGSFTGTDHKTGLMRVINALKQASAITENKVQLILETDSGAGNHLGGKFGEIADILKELPDVNLGVCLDTCHIFVAGYDISTPQKFDKVLAEFDKIIGLDRLTVIHLNDSKGALGSHLDRHEEIGKGFIGGETFKHIVNHPKLSRLAGIVETPDNKGADAERSSLKLLKDFRND